MWFVPSNHSVVPMCPPTCSGPEHDPVHPGAGPANPEGPAVRGEDGGAAPWPGDQVQAGGGEPQAEHRQAIQGMEPPTRPPFCHSCSVAHPVQPCPFCVCVFPQLRCVRLKTMPRSQKPIMHAESERLNDWIHKLQEFISLFHTNSVLINL